MKVVLISGDKYPFFLETANHLCALGHEVHLFCSKPLNRTNEITPLAKEIILHEDLNERFDLDKNIFRLLLFPLAAIKLKRILNKIKPDILHAFNLKWGGWLAALTNYHPFILTGLGSDILIEQGATNNLLLHYFRILTIKNADFLTVVSKQMDRQIKIVDPNKQTGIFAPGADQRIFDLNLVKPESKPNINIDINGKKIIFSPRGLKPIYQIKEIVLGFAQLKKTYENAVLILGGRDNPPYSEEVRELIDRLKIQESVYLTGLVNIDDWRYFFHISDLIVSYPSNDGMPATIFESMAMERPLILSDIPSMREIVTHNKDAILCDKDDINSLSKAFYRLLTDDNLVENIVEKAKETFARKGNALTHIKNLEKIYCKLLQSIG